MFYIEFGFGEQTNERTNERTSERANACAIWSVRIYLSVRTVVVVVSTPSRINPQRSIFDVFAMGFVLDLSVVPWVCCYRHLYQRRSLGSRFFKFLFLSGIVVFVEVLYPTTPVTKESVSLEKGG